MHNKGQASSRQKGIVVLTEGAPWKSILRFSLPLFLGSLLQQFYYSVDAVMVGRLVNEQALSGVGTCNVLINLLIALSVGFSTGSGIVSAQYYGAKQYKEIAKNVFATVISLAVLSVIIGGLGLVFGRALLEHFVSVPLSLLDYASIYFRICSVGFLFQFIYNGIAALLRSIGDSKASLYFLLLSTIMNVVLDYIFLKHFQIGVAGVAYATVISQFFVCIVSFVYMYRRYEVLRFNGKGIKIAWHDIELIFKTGFPMALQSVIGTVFNLMVQRLVNSFGEAMVASYTVVSRVEGYMHLPITTLFQAMTTYTAQNIGAEKPERIRIGLRQTIALSFSSTAVLSVLAFFCAPDIAGLFGISGLSAQYAITHIKCLSFPILSYTFYSPCTGVYQGAGKGMVSTGLSMTFLSICLILAYTLQHIPAIGYQALFICKPISWFLVAIINYIYYFKGKWKVSKAA